MENKRVYSIAIDGPAGAGKSTLARQLARRLGINPATLYRKINGRSDFYLWEVSAICQALDIPRAEQLFLSLAVTPTKQKEGRV